MRRLVLAAVLLVAAVGAGEAAAAAPPAAVVRAWSKALNANENVRAARLFAPHARVIQPGVDFAISSRTIAVAFNASLPCAGKILAIAVHGNRATATFLLGERPKHRCDAPGVKAAAVFTVRNGKIVRWQQVQPPASGVPA